MKSTSVLPSIREEIDQPHMDVNFLNASKYGIIAPAFVLMMFLIVNTHLRMTHKIL